MWGSRGRAQPLIERQRVPANRDRRAKRQVRLINIAGGDQFGDRGEARGEGRFVDRRRDRADRPPATGPRGDIDRGSGIEHPEPDQRQAVIASPRQRPQCRLERITRIKADEPGAMAGRGAQPSQRRLHLVRGARRDGRAQSGEQPRGAAGRRVVEHDEGQGRVEVGHRLPHVHRTLYRRATGA